MILDGMYLQNSIIGSAMQASVFRNSVISNNIANAETPGFKKSVVLFEDTLRRALDRKEQTGELNFSDVGMQAVKAQDLYSYRLDENNVDMETEMTALYQNAARYDALTACETNNSRRLSIVLSGRS
jgi:flagellar basal-body rod protein FlgB